MRFIVGFGILLLSLSPVVAAEPPAVTPAAVGEPMRIVPTVIGQPMNPRPAGDTPATAQAAAAAARPKLLIAPPETAAPGPAPIQVAGTGP